MTALQDNRRAGEETVSDQDQVCGEVRDSELDLAGVVNHMHYLIYMANARNKQMRKLGIPPPLPTKVDIQYKRPLFAGDEYRVTSRVSIFNERKKMRFVQTVEKKNHGQYELAAKATIEAELEPGSNTSEPETFQPLLF